MGVAIYRCAFFISFRFLSLHRFVCTGGCSFSFGCDRFFYSEMFTFVV